ncbi:MAG: glutaredoxin domain-containing protein [Polyangiaceae bacterium]
MSHDLACGPDGQCVLCHRSIPRRPLLIERAAKWLGALLVLAAVVGAAHRTWGVLHGSAGDLRNVGRTAPPAQPSAEATSGERSAADSANVHVVVYTTAWCPVCKRAKAWMRAQGIAFEERDVEASATHAHEMRTLNPRGGVPTFDVEGDVLVGFDPSQVMSSIRRAASQRRL